MNKFNYNSPLVVYYMTWLFVYTLYSLKWSYLYTSINTAIFLYVGLTLLLAYLISLKKQLNSITIDLKSSTKVFNLNETTCFVLLLLILLIDIVFTGYIPLLNALNGEESKYELFGAPVIHVLYVSAVSVYICKLAKNFIQYKSKKTLVYLIILLLTHIIYFNRGALIISISSIIFVYFTCVKIKLIHIIKLCCAVLVLLYLFGVLGNLRSSDGNNDLINSTIQPTTEFTESFVPPEFLWSYTYLTSPFANLNNVYELTKNNDKNINLENILIEILPDALTKRIYNETYINNYTIDIDNRISPVLNVATAYGRAVQNLGALGIVIVFYYYLIVVLLVTKFSKQGKYRVEIWAITCSLSLFLIFDNMLTFSGIITQLLMALMLNKYDKSSA